MISRRRRCCCRAGPKRSCICGGKAAISSPVMVGSSAMLLFSIAPWSSIFELDNKTASSGRVKPRSSRARRRDGAVARRAPALAHHLRPRQPAGDLGTGQAAILLRAPQQLLVGAEALDLAVE